MPWFAIVQGTGVFQNAQPGSGRARGCLQGGDWKPEDQRAASPIFAITLWVPLSPEPYPRLMIQHKNTSPHPQIRIVPVIDYKAWARLGHVDPEMGQARKVLELQVWLSLFAAFPLPRKLREKSFLTLSRVSGWDSLAGGVLSVVA